MAAGRRDRRAALGFSVHTGWAVLVAIGSGPEPSVVVLDRRRVEMIPGSDREHSRFVYHAASKLRLDAAERLVRESTDLSSAHAKAALETAVAALEAREYDVVASSLVVGERPAPGALERILASHARIHAAEGELFREAIRSASKALRLPITEVRAKDLRARAATTLGISTSEVERHLAAIGRAAGRPWSKDHKDACLAATIALGPRATRP